MAAKQLTQETLKSILHYDPDTGFFTWRVTRGRIRAGTRAGSRTTKGYLAIYIFGVNYRAHRLAWLYMTGKWPAEQIDHKDRCKSNNRFDNLRESSNKQNHENRLEPRSNTSGHIGVYWYKPYKKWTALLTHYGRTIFLGYFESFDAAVAARREGEQAHFSRPAQRPEPRPRSPV